MQSPEIPAIGTIRYLTAFLAQVDVRDPEPPKGEQLSTSMKFLAHISTLLNIGKFNGEIVAVTGQLDKDKAKATIVVSKNSFTRSDGSRFDVEPACVTPTEFEENDIKLLANLPNTDKSVLFPQHVKDLIGVLQLYCKSKLKHAYVSRWVTHRCHRKLSYRLEHMEREWETKPTVTMKGWEPTDSDRKFIESHACILNDLKVKTYQGVLKDANITTITLDSGETAKTLICGIANLLDEAHKLLEPKKLKTVTFLEIDYVFKLLLTLDVILSNDVIRYIITESSLSYLFQPKAAHDEGMTQPEGGAGVEQQSDPNDREDQDDDEVAETEQLPNETKGEHVFRYMLTLTAWITASSVVCGRLRKAGKQLSASIVTLNDYSEQALMQMGKLQDDIIGQLKVGMTDSTWLVSQAEKLRISLEKRHVKPPRVHAEAGLMALAKAARDGTVVINSQEVKDILMADLVEIGVSKKCCYMCSMLGRVLSRGTDANRMAVQLPGTHGHVFSWDPPQFGVSLSVLNELANALKDKVIELAKRNASYGTRTRQSSPASEIEAASPHLDDSDDENFPDTSHVKWQ